MRERFDHVLVDEYQDTNALQADIVSLLRPDGTGVTCVGDDAQAIYAFRAATVRNILDFEQRFPGAEVVTLTRNYRSTAPILAATNAIIAEAAERREKDLWTERADGGRPVLVTCRDEDEQTQWLCERILDHREQGTQLKQQAVLFRAQHHSMALEMELSRRNIPFHKYGGLRFVEMAHVKDLMSFLRLAENPRDAMAGLRVLGLVPGIGPKTAAALLESLGAAAGDFEAWVGARVPEPARAVWPDFVGSSPHWAPPARRRSRAGPRRAQRLRAAARASLRQRAGAPARSRADRGARGALADAHAVARRARARPAGVHAGPRRPAAARRGLPHPLHHALGQGAGVRRRLRHPRRRRQHPIGHGDRLAAEIEEERRLFYVACTRARDQLYVSHPLRYYTQPWAKADTHGYAQRTRFLTHDVVTHFDEIQTGPEVTEAEEGPLDRVTTASIRAGVRSLWETPAET